MAVANKQINGSVSISGRGYSFWLICKESDVNKTNNTSDVTVEAHIKSTTTRTATSGWTFSITINGKEYKETSKTLDNYGGGSIATNTDVKVYSKMYDNVPHTSNGTKTVSVSCTLSKGTYGSYDPGTCTASGTFTLTSIPRMSKPSVGSNPLIDEETVNGSTVVNTTAVTVSANSNSSDYRFKLQVLDGNTVVETLTNSTVNSAPWTPSLNTYASRIPSSEKAFTIKSTGVSGISDSDTCPVTVKIKRTNITAPTTNSTLVSYTDLANLPQALSGLLIQTKSRLRFLVGQVCYTGASPKKAGIKIDNNQTSSTTLDTEDPSKIVVDMPIPFQTNGQIKAYGNVMDSRGFRYIETDDSADWVELKTIEVLPYRQPGFIDEPSVSRVDSNGEPSDQGTYLAYSMNARVSAIRYNNTNKNTGVFKVRYKPKGSPDSSYVDCSFTGTYNSTTGYIEYNASNIKLQNNGTDVQISATTAYDIQFLVSDIFAESQDTRNKSIVVGADLLNFNVNGHAMAIGQLSTASQNEEKLEIAYPTVFKNMPSIQGNPLANYLLDAFYPVGSIYMSTTRDDSTVSVVGKAGCPIAELGGTWERIQGQFLLAANDAYTDYQAGATGGSVTKTIAIANLPAHTHGSKTLTGRATFRDSNTSDHNTILSTSGIFSKGSRSWSGSHWGMSGSTFSGYMYNDLDVTATHEHSSVGSGTALNIMPPFVSVYTWKRTA